MLHEQQHDTAARQPGVVSRRRLIFTGASLAAAGVAVGAAAAIPLTAGDNQAQMPDGGGANPAEPVMVHLRDAATGRFDVFVGTRRIQLDDRAFAARLANAVTAS
ncbi:hypothetical protein [Actinophytocola sp.]|uniref:hypothetical protein n=1 Tax=Actinophytocola sp. TaxID=1872138 RepID=UPI002ED611C4